MVKWILGIGLALVVAGGATYAFVGPEKLGLSRFGLGGQAGEGERKTPVQIQKTEVGDLVRTVAAPGAIEARTLVNISSQVSARITALPFREGDRVQAGDVVVRLDPQDLVARLASAKAQLTSERARLQGAEADVITARLEFERIESLFETGDATQAEREQSEAAYLRSLSNRDALNASIQIAEAGIEQVETDIANTVIESPIDGVITALNTEVGETAIVGTTNTAGSVIMEVADLTQMLFKAQVDETNIASVAEGQRATIFITAFPDEEFRGEVQQIGLKRQASAQGTGYFDVEILIDQVEGGSRLLNGMTATCEIDVETVFDVIKAPTQSVVDRRTDDLPQDVRANEIVDTDQAFQQIVYVIEDGKTVAKPVKIGASDLTHTVILEGVEAGVELVAGPYRILPTLRGGMAVIDEKEAGPRGGGGGQWRGRGGGRPGR